MIYPPLIEIFSHSIWNFRQPASMQEVGSFPFPDLYLLAGGIGVSRIMLWGGNKVCLIFNRLSKNNHKCPSLGVQFPFYFRGNAYDLVLPSRKNWWCTVFTCWFVDSDLVCTRTTILAPQQQVFWQKIVLFWVVVTLHPRPGHKPYQCIAAGRLIALIPRLAPLIPRWVLQHIPSRYRSVWGLSLHGPYRHTSPLACVSCKPGVTYNLVCLPPVKL